MTFKRLEIFVFIFCHLAGIYQLIGCKTIEKVVEVVEIVEEKYGKTAHTKTGIDKR